VPPDGATRNGTSQFILTQKQTFRDLHLALANLEKGKQTCRQLISRKNLPPSFQNKSSVFLPELKSLIPLQNALFTSQFGLHEFANLAETPVGLI